MEFSKLYELNIPEDRELLNREKKIPFVIVADDAFSLQAHIMKPYAKRDLSMPERVFNYRLSRARRIIENAFGIASARFRCLRRTFESGPKRVTTIVSAVCVLHNFCMRRSRRLYAPPSYIDSEENGVFRPGEWRLEASDGLHPHVGVPQHHPSLQAKEIQKELTEFFVTEAGEVRWQYNSCGITQ